MGKAAVKRDGITKLSLLIMADGRPQYMVAADLRVSPSRLSQYSLGVRPIPAARIYEFCNFFRVNPDELLGWVDEG